MTDITGRRNTLFPRRLVAAGAVAFVLALCSAAPAFSQAMVCGAKDKVEARLQAGYSEVPVAEGLAPAGVIQVWASEAGTFTVVLVRTDGLACLLAVGDSFDLLTPKRGRSASLPYSDNPPVAFRASLGGRHAIAGPPFSHGQ